MSAQPAPLRPVYLTRPPSELSSDVSLRELGNILWSGKWIVLAIAVLFSGVAIAIASSLPRTYRAEVVVVPVAANTSGIASALLSQIGSLSPINTSGLVRDDTRNEAIAVLSSTGLAAEYIERNNLLPLLYPKLWDPQARRWKDARRVPTLWQASTALTHDIRRITEDTRSGTFSVTITWTDPVLAARWANGLVAATNDYLKSKALRDSDHKIQYLSTKASQARQVPLQNALYTALESQLEIAAMTSGTQEYALRVIDAAVPPEQPAGPKPLLWALAAFAAGMCVAVLFVFARRGWDSSR